MGDLGDRGELGSSEPKDWRGVGTDDDGGISKKDRGVEDDGSRIKMCATEVRGMVSALVGMPATGSNF